MDGDDDGGGKGGGGNEDAIVLHTCAEEPASQRAGTLPRTGGDSEELLEELRCSGHD